MMTNVFRNVNIFHFDPGLCKQNVYSELKFSDRFVLINFMLDLFEKY